MPVNFDQKVIALREIKKKGEYCYFPVVLTFIAAVISIIAGAKFDIFNLVIFPGLSLSLVLIAYHVLSTKCPNCNHRFYSLWDLVLSGTRRYSCCNCKFSLVSNNQSKSTGEEWNQ